MVFSSVIFLCYFLPIVLAVYFLVPARFRNAVALLASLFFYSWGAPRFVFVLILFSLLDYVIGERIAPRSRDGTDGTDGKSGSAPRKTLLAIAIAANLVLLGYFKYMNFFVEQFNGLLANFGGEPAAWTAVALPIGISFFTFQKISYLIDVYRGTTQPARSFVHHLLYVSLFPQLIAGPIVRYHDVAEQLTSRSVTSEKALQGLWRFAVGLVKKLLIANVLGAVANDAFDIAPDRLTAFTSWLGAVCFAFQIYFDFSAYSDMAIGLGRMLGFEFPENFNSPYRSTGFTEFWRRWHISLSNWMREYLYIPLGGNRVGKVRQAANLWIVFLLSGMWHGAAWNFIAWGAFHGFFLSLEKFMPATWRKSLEGPESSALIRAVIRTGCVLLTFLLVTIAWVPFKTGIKSLEMQNKQVVAEETVRADMFGNLDSGDPAKTYQPMAHTQSYLASMFGVAEGSSLSAAIYISPQRCLAFGIALVCSFIPCFFQRDLSIEWRIESNSVTGMAMLLIRTLLTALLLVLALMILVTSDFNPFIYFQF